MVLMLRRRLLRRLVVASCASRSSAAPVVARRAPRARLGAARPRRRSGRVVARSASSGSTFSAPRDVDDGEEEVAELVRRRARSGSVSGAGAPARAELRLELVELLARPWRAGRRDRASRSRPPRRAAAPCAPGGAREASPGRRGRSPRGPPARVLSCLPALAHAPGVRASASPNTCGCRRTSFVVDAARDVVEVAGAPLLEQQREEVRPGRGGRRARRRSFAGVAGERGVGDLVGLLDRVRDDRPRRLLAIPGAVRGAGAGSAPGGRRAPPRAHRAGRYLLVGLGRSCVAELAAARSPAA